MRQAQPTEPEPAPPSKFRRRALIVGGLLAVVGLAAGAYVMSSGDDESADPEPEPTTTTETTLPDVERPAELTATESQVGVQLEWAGDSAADYAVLVLSEAESPQVMPAQVGTSQLVPATSLRPDVGYCFAVALLSTLTEMPSGQAAEAFSSPACIRGASQDTIVTD